MICFCWGVCGWLLWNVLGLGVCGWLLWNVCEMLCMLCVCWGLWGFRVQGWKMGMAHSNLYIYIHSIYIYILIMVLILIMEMILIMIVILIMVLTLTKYILILMFIRLYLSKSDKSLSNVLEIYTIISDSAPFSHGRCLAAGQEEAWQDQIHHETNHEGDAAQNSECASGGSGGERDRRPRKGSICKMQFYNTFYKHRLYIIVHMKVIHRHAYDVDDDVDDYYYYR